MRPAGLSGVLFCLTTLSLGAAPTWSPAVVLGGPAIPGSTQDFTQRGNVGGVGIELHDLQVMSLPSCLCSTLRLAPLDRDVAAGLRRTVSA